MKNSTKTVAIVAGGALRVNQLRFMKEAFYIIGVDRGALWLVQHRIRPDLAIGDFDSVNQREKTLIHKQAKSFQSYPSKKNATDLELAIDEAIKLHPDSVTIYGALGGRVDHAFAAVGLLLRLESHNILGQIVDNFNKINIVRRLATVERSREYTYISVFPMADKAVITMKGFAYDVSRHRLISGSTLGVSNEIRNKIATIIVHEGAALVIESRDRRVR